METVDFPTIVEKNYILLVGIIHDVDCEDKTIKNIVDVDLKSQWNLFHNVKNVISGYIVFDVRIV